MSKAESLIRQENDDVRITEWRLPPGTSTGYHRHDLDYIVVPITTGRLKASGAAGDIVADFEPGAAYHRKAGIEHDVTNIGDAPLIFVEIELKRGASSL